MAIFEVGKWVTFRYVDETLTGIIRAVQSNPDMCNIEVNGEMYYEAFEDLTPAILVQLAPAPDAPTPAVADGGDVEHELAVARYTIGAVEGAADYLSKQVVELEAENKRLKDALEPFAEAWVQLPLDPTSKLVVEPPNGLLSFTLGITAKALQDAHTALYGK